MSCGQRISPHASITLPTAPNHEPQELPDLLILHTIICRRINTSGAKDLKGEYGLDKVEGSERLDRQYELRDHPHVLPRGLMCCIHKLCMACAVGRLSFGPFDVGFEIIVGETHSPSSLSDLFHRGHGWSVAQSSITQRKRHITFWRVSYFSRPRQQATCGLCGSHCAVRLNEGYNAVLPEHRRLDK
jgi:hypothetical protein